MARLLVSLLFLYIGYRIVKALFAKKSGREPVPAPPAAEDTVQDPICGVYIAKEDAVVGTLEGTRHYFCSMDCLEKFRDRLDHTPSSNSGGTA
ncbi:YHS domain-containing protein [Trichlorobacter ammonificans]|uniref:YHS domain-containing protein n=1 Tax=Trichlorobacter ammonificans TaxID=2916410 RepID=A0ABN8HIT0_9BACT|nr:YHS domain-containing protein [Trichlorobacter ammonificans]CAH2032664.1 YHS domain-containing protein [Trichlorobacter ammonificans]